MGRLPESGQPLCSQPTMSRLENAPSKIEIARLMAAMVDLFCDSYRREPALIEQDAQVKHLVGSADIERRNRAPQ